MFEIFLYEKLVVQIQNLLILQFGFHEKPKICLQNIFEIRLYIGNRKLKFARQFAQGRTTSLAYYITNRIIPFSTEAHSYVCLCHIFIRFVMEFVSIASKKHTRRTTTYNYEIVRRQ